MGKDMNMIRLMNDLKRDEGFMPKVYTCSAGKLTVGYGWNLEDNNMPEHIAHALLEHAINEKIKQLSKYQWFCNLDAVRKSVIANMAFNIGVNGVLKFKKMVSAIEDKNYTLAADEMEDSNWYKQVGIRAQRLVETMRTGV